MGMVLCLLVTHVLSISFVRYALSSVLFARRSHGSSFVGVVVGLRGASCEAIGVYACGLWWHQGIDGQDARPPAVDRCLVW